MKTAWFHLFHLLYKYYFIMKEKEYKEDSDEKMTKINQDLLKTNGNIKINIIYADPPWDYRSGETIKGRANQHYETMPLKELKQLNVSEIAAKDCILFLWTTGPQLNNALELMRCWGVKYVTMFFVWVKTTNGNVNGGRCGYYTRQSSEFVLMGTKERLGNIKVIQIITYQTHSLKIQLNIPENQSMSRNVLINSL